VLTHDATLVDFSIKRFSVARVTGESLLAVGNIKTSIAGSLHSTKDLCTSGGIFGSNVEKGAEWLLLIINLLNIIGLAIVFGGDRSSLNVLNPRIHLV